MFVFFGRDFGKGTLKFRQGQIKRKVVDMFARALELFEQDFNLSEIPRDVTRLISPESLGEITYPLPNSSNCASYGILSTSLLALMVKTSISALVK